MRSWLGIVGALTGCATTVEEPASMATSPGAMAPLLADLPGVWAGSVEDTPIGDLPVFVIDLAPAGEGKLFGRADLDGDTYLRFLLADTEAGGRFRNAASFAGLGAIDHTAALQSAEGGRYRFCADGDDGCDYLDLSIAVDGDDLTMNVAVRGVSHFTWEARRAVDVPAAEGIAADSELPSWPTVDVQVSWTGALEAPADVWALVSRTPCARGCTPSRLVSAAADVGAESIALTVPQLAPGAWYVTVFLDRDRNAASTGFGPDPGDGVALPDRQLKVNDDAVLDVAVVTDLG